MTPRPRAEQALQPPGFLQVVSPNKRYWRLAVSLLRMSCSNYRRSLKQVNEVALARDEG